MTTYRIKAEVTLYKKLDEYADVPQFLSEKLDDFQWRTSNVEEVKCSKCNDICVTIEGRCCCGGIATKVQDD